MTAVLTAEPPELIEFGSPQIQRGAPQRADDLAALAARVVAAWPELSRERKAELGNLLAT